MALLNSTRAATASRVKAFEVSNLLYVIADQILGRLVFKWFDPSDQTRRAPTP